MHWLLLHRHSLTPHISVGRFVASVPMSLKWIHFFHGFRYKAHERKHKHNMSEKNNAVWQNINIFCCCSCLICGNFIDQRECTHRYIYKKKYEINKMEKSQYLQLLFRINSDDLFWGLFYIVMWWNMPNVVLNHAKLKGFFFSFRYFLWI